MDQSEICGEEVSEEDVWLRGSGGGEQKIPSLEREEVQETQQLHQSP